MVTTSASTLEPLAPRSAFGYPLYISYKDFTFPNGNQNNNYVDQLGIEIAKLMPGVVGMTSKNFRKVLEFGFKNVESRDQALKSDYHIGGFTFRPKRAYNFNENITIIRLSSLPCIIYGEELVNQLKITYNQYGNVISAVHHLINGSEELYSQNATIVIALNDVYKENSANITRILNFG